MLIPYVTSLDNQCIHTKDDVSASGNDFLEVLMTGKDFTIDVNWNLVIYKYFTVFLVWLHYFYDIQV